MTTVPPAGTSARIPGKRCIRFAPLLAIVLAVACQDPNMRESRGYTKAPLEHPNLVIRGEQPSEISRYGAPNRVRVEEIQLPEQTATAAPAPTDRPQVELPEGVTQEMVAAGEQLYGGAGNCFTCHAPTGAGTPLAPALTDNQWINIDGSYESIVDIIAAGVPNPQQHPAPMPARGGGAITDEQVRQIAAYVYVLSR